MKNHCKHFGFIKVNRSLSNVIKTFNLVKSPESHELINFD